MADDPRPPAAYTRDDGPCCCGGTGFCAFCCVPDLYSLPRTPTPEQMAGGMRQAEIAEGYRQADEERDARAMGRMGKL